VIDDPTLVPPDEPADPGPIVNDELPDDAPLPGRPVLVDTPELDVPGVPEETT
jgi:hypothetical protein